MRQTPSKTVPEQPTRGAIMAVDLTILRTRLIDAIEALQEGNISQYGVVLEFTQFKPGSPEMTAVQSILNEMGVGEKNLEHWLDRYVSWMVRSHIEALRHFFKK
jgi:hypothetical protein